MYAGVVWCFPAAPPALHPKHIRQWDEGKITPSWIWRGTQQSHPSTENAPWYQRLTVMFQRKKKFMGKLCCLYFIPNSNFLVILRLPRIPKKLLWVLLWVLLWALIHINFFICLVSNRNLWEFYPIKLRIWNGRITEILVSKYKLHWVLNSNHWFGGRVCY